MELIGVAGRAREAWVRVLAEDPAAVIFQTPAWLDSMCAAGLYEDATRAYRTNDGRILVLPLVRLRHSPTSAAVRASLPRGWGTGGLVASGGRIGPGDVAGVAADLAALRGLRTTLRPGPAAAETWDAGVPGDVVRSRHMVQSVDLSGGFEDVWRDGFSSSVRRACKKAERSGVEVVSGSGRDLVAVFDGLYRRSVTRWATQEGRSPRVAQWKAGLREPRRKFEVVADHLGPACRIWLARVAGRPAAAIVALSHAGHVNYWRGAMDMEAEAGTRANDLLHRMAIEAACASGARFYHMGESAPESSLARFKRGFGAREHHYTGYRFERLPLTRGGDVARRRGERAVAAARRLPRRQPSTVRAQGS